MSSANTVIFLHIPKTAGTTLNQILQRQYPRQTAFFMGANAQASIDQYKDLDTERKSDIRLIAGHMSFGFHRFVPNPALYFTFLRDPIKRVLSFYRYVMNSEQHYLNYAVVNELGGLRPFMNSGITKMVDNGQTRLISGAWLEPDYGEVNAELFEKARDNLQRHFKVVGLTEQFDTALLLLQESFGWREIHYVRQNVGKSSERQKQVSDAEVEVIQSFNRWDIALYAFAEELFLKQVENSGPDFQRRLEAFRKKNQRYQRYKAPMEQAARRLRQFSVRSTIRDLLAG